MNITDNDIKKICSDSVFRTGTDYFKEGRVHIRVRSNDSIVASVDSDKLYNVHIGFDETGKISETFCTCPYYQTMSSNCKHIVATLKTRQAELENGEKFEDNNDKMANKLCKEFEIKNNIRTQMPISFIFNINTNHKNECSYSMAIKLGKNDNIVPGVEGFIKAFASGEEYKISKHKTYKKSEFYFDNYSEHILLILVDALENKYSGTSFYTPKLTYCDFGASTAKRLLPLLQYVDCTFTVNSMPQPNMLVKTEDPDIMVDITATHESINISVIQGGLSIIPDGSWFLYNGDLYETSAQWRDWYMPIYEALSFENRTQLDFRGSNSISFAANVLPRIKGKMGVVAQGIENIIVDDRPNFDLYFDRTEDGIFVAITASYGNISLRLPTNEEQKEKIIVRDYTNEKYILSFFDNFNLEGQNLYLSDSDEIYDFITVTMPKLSTLCDIHTSQSFDSLRITNAPKIKSKVTYKKDIDLLEVGFESDLTASEMAGIISSIRNKKKYFRMRDGAFLDINEQLSGFELLGSLDFSFSDLKERKKVISKYYALFLAASLNANLSSNDEFDKLIDEIRSIKANIPPYLNKTLREYQKTAVHWIKQLSELGFGGILADDMGLGKTLEIISFVMSEAHSTPTLVVAPSSLTYNWLSEISKFTPTAKAKVIDGTKEDREKALTDISEYDFIITSYPLLRRDIESYLDKDFFACVIDEAQHIKNPKTLSAKAVKKIRANSFFALSGTPIENSLSELWSIFDFIMPNYLGQKAQFTEYYEKPIIHDGDDETAQNLRKKIKPFVMRRMKYDVLSELPEKIENTFYAEPSPSQKKLYLSFLALAKKEASEIVKYGGDNMKILALLTRLRQICCHPRLIDESYDKESGKLQLFEDLLLSGLSAGHRILVFSQFTSMLSIIKERLDELKIDYFYMDGGTSSFARTDMADKFNGGEKSVFLVSLKAGGTGLNLVGADMVIHYDPWWNPAMVDQASDRAYRIGQTRAVHIIKLATKGTIEEQILKLQDKKKGLADDIIRTNSATLSNLTKEELLSFFK